MHAETAPDLVVGIDIGGTGIKGAAVDVAAGKLAAARVRVPTPKSATPQSVSEVAGEVLQQIGAAGPVGITVPAVRAGIVDTASHIDLSCCGIDAVELFSKATGRPTAVVNDADAAGIAELRFGAGRGRDGVIVMITLGTGIGSALFADGTLVRNSELGHLLLLHHGEAEDWAAGSIRENDHLSWKKYAHRLQGYLELVQHLLWPEQIIIGGGVSKKADKFLPRIELQTPVVPAELHNDAGIIGAALLAAEVAPACPSGLIPSPITELQ